MRRTNSNLKAVLGGAFLRLLAVSQSLTTVGKGGYRAVLAGAMIFALLALGCLVVPVYRGPIGWRIVAAVLALPALFVFWDFALRGPHAFGFY